MNFSAETHCDGNQNLLESDIASLPADIEDLIRKPPKTLFCHPADPWRAGARKKYTETGSSTASYRELLEYGGIDEIRTRAAREFNRCDIDHNYSRSG